MKKFLYIAASIVMFLSTFTSSTFAANYFNGGYHSYSGNNLTSVYIDIKTPNYPVTGTGSGSVAWPMVVNHDLAEGRYAQVGWIKGNGINGLYNNVKYFYEINYGGGRDYQVYNTYGPAENTTHGYRMYLTDNNYWVGQVDGANIGTYWAEFNASEVQYFEEIAGPNAYAAQFAGSSANKTIFSNLRTYYNGVAYYSPSLVFYSDNEGSRDTSNYTAGNSASIIKLWDARY